MNIFQSNNPKDMELVNAMGGALADRMAGYIIMLGEEYKNGNTAPLLRVCAPVMAAMRSLATSMMDGAIGNIKKDLTSGLDENKLLAIRNRLGKKQQGWFDLVYAFKDMFGPSGGGNAPKGKVITQEYVEVK